MKDYQLVVIVAFMNLIAGQISGIEKLQSFGKFALIFGAVFWIGDLINQANTIAKIQELKELEEKMLKDIKKLRDSVEKDK